MSEGDVWANATDSTLHFEKEMTTQDTPLQTSILQPKYWCGMVGTDSHHRVEGNADALTYASIDARRCKRCIRNRSK